MTALGYTAEGSDVTVNIGQNWIPRTHHQTGQMPTNFYDGGQTIEVTIDFDEIVNWDLWAEVFKIGEKQVDSGCSENVRFTGHASSPLLSGTAATSLDQFLILRPTALYTDADTETARDFVIPRAIPTNLGDIPFGLETPNIVPVTFMGIGDPSATDGSVLWYRGLTTPITAWGAA
jgi:hypothetical protein